MGKNFFRPGFMQKHMHEKVIYKPGIKTIKKGKIIVEQNG